MSNPVATQIRCEWLPLHPAQQDVYYDQLVNPASPHYNTGGYVVIRGELDKALLQQVVAQAPATFDALRLSFDYSQPTPACRFAQEFEPLPLPSIDFRGFDDPASEARHWMQARFDQPFDLQTNVLMEQALLVVADTEHWWFNRYHHLITDASGFAIGANFVARSYTALKLGTPLPAADDYPPYEAEIAASANYQQSPAYPRDRAYWNTKFADAPPALLTRKPTPTNGTNEGSDSLVLEISDDLRRTFDQIAAETGTSLQQLTIGALMLYFGRLNPHTDLVLGIPTYNRRKHQWNVMGMFAGLIPFRGHYQPNQTVGELLRDVRNQQLTDYRHQNYPISHLNRDLHLLQQGRSQLFDVVVNYLLLNFDLQFGHVAARTHDLLSHQVENPLQFWWRDYGARQPLELRVDFQYAYFTKEEARQLADRLLFVMAQFANQIDVPVAKLALLDSGEIAQLQSFNPLPTPRPVGQTLLSELNRQALKTPTLPAIELAGNTLTYAQLHQQANQLAHRLRQAGAGPGTTVAIGLERTLNLFVGLLAVLKTGATYVAIPPDYPTDRQRFMLTDSGATLWLTELTDELTDAPTCPRIHPASKDEVGKDQANVKPDVNLLATDPAYLIYTSGSTGQPKGVVISQGAVLDYCLTFGAYFELTQADRVIQQASIAFDTMVEEIFPAWLCGACVVLLKEGGRDVETLANELTNNGITILSTTPSVIQWLNRHVTDLGQLRYLISGGEVLHPAHIDRLLDKVAVVNTYGPSESTVCVTYNRIADLAEAALLGQPIANRDVVILNEAGDLLPLGAVGELCIGGAGLMTAYHNQSDGTAARLVANPFNPAANLYRSGDLARWLPNGTLEYVGRRDDQVKIRGYRIELGEVEAALQAVAGVCQAAVAVHTGTGSPRLMGYAVVLDGTSAVAILAELRHVLPDYMLPAQVVLLTALPLLANGKVDRKNLPAPPAADLDAPVTAATNDVEYQLVTIWQTLFDRMPIGIHDNFFELGGDSILTIQVVSRMRQAGYSLQPRHLFDFPTIAQLAPHVGRDESVTAETGLLVGEVPLLPIQHQFLAESPAAESHYNQTVLLAVDKTVPMAWLERAFALLLAQHDALRLVFDQSDEGIWTQRYADNAPNPVAQADLRHTTDWTAALADESDRAQASLNIRTGQLLRCLLLQTPDHEPQNRLLLVVHHLAVDGVSWRILLDELLLLVRAQAAGQLLALGRKSASYRQWAAYLTDMAQQEKTMATLPYWQNLVADQLALPTDYPVVTATMSQVNTLRQQLPAALTTALLTTAHRPYQTQIDDLLLTALSQTLTHWTGYDRVVIGREGHGRDDAADAPDSSQTVGWFTLYYPLALGHDRAASDRQWIQTVKEQIRTAPRNGLGYGALRYLHPDADVRNSLHHATEVTFSYLGQFDRHPEQTDWFAAPGQPAASSSAADNRFGAKFAIACSVQDGQLLVDWQYATTQYQEATVATLVNTFIANLTRLTLHGSALTQTLPTPSDYQLAGLASQAELDGFWTENNLPDTVEAIYRLSPLQEGMLFHSLYDATSTDYIDQIRCTVEAFPDPERFRQSWEQLVREHTILRTAFPHSAFETPLQAVYSHADLPFRFIDLSALSATALTARVNELAEADLQAGFDLEKPPLLRVTVLKRTPTTCELIWTNHHLLIDGWSLPVMMKKLIDRYVALLQGEQPVSKPADRYEDFIRLLENRPQQAEDLFWRQYVANVDQPTLLPFAANRQARNKGKSATRNVTWTADAALTGQIKAFLLTQHLTINTLCQGVWAMLLGHYTQRPNVTFGVTVSGRMAELAQAEERIGLYINTLPLCVRLNNDTPVTQWLADLQQQQATMREFQHKSLRSIQQLTQLSGDWFDSLMVVENYPMASLTNYHAAFPITEVRLKGETNFMLTLVVYPEPMLAIQFGYQTSLLDEEAMEQIISQFDHTLRQLVSQPQQPVGAVAVITPVECEFLKTVGSQLVNYKNGSYTVVDQVVWQAQQKPQQTALVFGHEQLTYRALNRQANQLAHYLTSLGAGPGQLIGLCVERSPYLLVGLLAILKTGAAYIPIDPATPAERVQHMLDDAAATLVLCQQQTLAKLENEAGRRCLCLDLPGGWLNQPDSNPVTLPTTDDLAYCLYTSGSTGRPKGVRISHRSLTNYLLTSQAHYLDGALPNQTATLIHLNIAFDASVTALLAPLMAGKASLIAQGDALSVFNDPALWQYAPYDFIKLTPAQLPLLAMALELNPDCPPLTRRLVVGGEALLPVQYQFWTENPSQPVTIINEYGPTEATVGCCWYAFQPGKGEVVTAGGVLIGRPMPNVQLYVLDQQGQMVSPGVTGELYIGGTQVADGYQNRPDLTQERFVMHPLGRLYRTGDLAYWTADGELAYCGRADDQIKLRGHRIEIGEIDVVLQAAPGVLAVTVVAQRDGQTVTGLAGYVVLAEDGSLEAVQAYAAAHLPAYMLPKWLVVVDKLPLTANGKIDKRALPPVSSVALPNTPTGPTRPATATEATLTVIWQQVLGLPTVGLFDNFFELGGDSIQSIQVVSRARKEGLTLYPKDLFDHPTIAQLALVVGQKTVLMAEQGMLSGSADLMPMQQAFLQNDGLVRDHFNQAMLLNVPKRVSPGQLAEALLALMHHHDALRFRYEQHQEQWQQHYTHDPTTLLLEDLTTTPLAHLSTALTAACQRHQESLNIVTGPLLRFVWFNTPDAHNRLLLVMHHLVVDSHSWAIFLRDLATCLTAATAQTAPDLGQKTMSYRQWQAALATYATTGTTHQQLPYWQAISAEAKPLPTDFPLAYSDVDQVVTHEFSLDAPTTAALLHEAHQAYHTDVQTLLLVALGQTVANWTGRQQLTLGLQGHGRDAIADQIDVSRTVGWFTNQYPVALAIGTDDSLPYLIRSVKEQLKRVPDAGIGYGALRYLHPDAAVRESLNNGHTFTLRMNYVAPDEPVGPPTTACFSTAHESVGRLIAGDSAFDNQFDLHFFVDEGRLHGHWRYATNQYMSQTVSRLATQLCHHLTTVVQHCLGQHQTRLSPSDYGLGDTLNVQELDALLTAIDSTTSDVLVF
ncbi:non-ribosomal peptide synthetase [Fibrella aquatilis]|uniref:Amino acid adenylation domain-containing protein n=1 Tax=Fibrella aquatilis TaxID=2817059 RepID=A0A939G6C5_9BACT|nr:non-ribosomal peptide synthetase [Fibrella aquatilis]MBO0932989.1 amino acid adenylation domain-containing protein [Fibrella aquatilis]